MKAFAASTSTKELDPKNIITTQDKNEINTIDELFEQKKFTAPEMVDESDNVPPRTVRIELRQVVGAHFYEVNVIPAHHIWADPMKFVVPAQAPTVRLRLQPGEYSIRTRSLDEKKLPGPWGSYKKFWVDFRPILNAFPKANEVIPARSKDKESLTFEWPHIKNAKLYFFRLKDSNGKIIRMAITKQMWLTSQVDIDKQYTWSILPMSKEDEYMTLLKKDYTAPYTMFRVINSNELGREAIVKVQPQKAAIKYQYDIVSYGNTETPVASIIDSYDYVLHMRLIPGEYEVRVRSVHEDNSHSEWSAPSKIYVKRFLPKLISPIQSQVVDSTDDEQSEVHLKWKKDLFAANYKVYLFDEKDNLIQTLRTKDNVATVKLPDNKSYKWAVRALSEREPAADDDINPDETNGAFVIDKYVPLDLGITEEPSQYYSWVKQSASLENYLGANYENNALIKQLVFGGTNEVALGRWWRKSKLGLLGQASVNEFVFRNMMYTYGDTSLLLGYRKFLENGDRLRLFGGVEYHENPEVITNPFTSVVNYSKLTSYGPKFEFQYQRPLTNKAGINFSGSIYDSAIGIETTNGMPAIPQLSLHLSALGTYIYNQDIRFMAGYTYGIEQAAYYSADTPGAINTATISGHYFSFMIDFGLEPMMK